MSLVKAKLYRVEKEIMRKFIPHLLHLIANKYRVYVHADC